MFWNTMTRMIILRLMIPSTHIIHLKVLLKTLKPIFDVCRVESRHLHQRFCNPRRNLCMFKDHSSPMRSPKIAEDNKANGVRDDEIKICKAVTYVELCVNLRGHV